MASAICYYTPLGGSYTYKANILRTCIVPVDVVVNVKMIEELSLMKNGVLNSELSKSEIDELLQNICCE